MSESLIFAHFLFFGERCEWIAHFAQIKWAMWANPSFRSPKMSDHERFTQVAQRKWAMWANNSFCSFFDKKRTIRSEIKWANSQPWVQYIHVDTKNYLGPWRAELPEVPKLEIKRFLEFKHGYNSYWLNNCFQSHFATSCNAYKIFNQANLRTWL